MARRGDDRPSKDPGLHVQAFDWGNGWLGLRHDRAGRRHWRFLGFELTSETRAKRKANRAKRHKARADAAVRRARERARRKLAKRAERERLDKLVAEAAAEQRAASAAPVTRVLEPTAVLGPVRAGESAFEPPPARDDTRPDGRGEAAHVAQMRAAGLCGALNRDGISYCKRVTRERPCPVPGHHSQNGGTPA